MVDPAQMEDRSVEIIQVHRPFRDIITEVVGLPDADAAFHTSACHPHAKIARMMIAPVVGLGEGPLRINGPPEFTPPHHERRIEKASLF